ncbi:hypothetical protein KY290_034001 [Solanum tuberosum]|uniref:Uncharacterized protein n=1 Tax=Solanum tuberosum TaxID=4113 RepID=A0ABQ7U3R9_SOLTU|nr:hypothetical protein KY289_033381 [Solanum tuberosum]KAH0648017.1 hypothetical protein KY285_033265 [Solanum tuberosum]KAH0740958.1 hypothetical protein KY290_034001 [Solanum tuberosum]
MESLRTFGVINLAMVEEPCYPYLCAFESPSIVGNLDAEQLFDEMRQTEDSPFNSDNEVLVDERSDAIVFSSESHSALEDEKSEDGCDLQYEFEGSMSAVQEILVVKD